jgi:Protein of unknown function (DUF2933)
MKMHRMHMWIMGGAAALVVVYALATGGSLASALPLILALGACTLMMMLMMRGMGHGGPDATRHDSDHTAGNRDIPPGAGGAGRHGQ